MTTTVTAEEAEMDLSRLLGEVEAGGEVVIERSGRVIARLVAAAEAEESANRVFGAQAGMITLNEGWDTPDYSEDELAAYEQAPLFPLRAP